MLISAAVCPHPPLLVPELAGTASAELDGLRAACDEAVRRLVGAPHGLPSVSNGLPSGANGLAGGVNGLPSAPHGLAGGANGLPNVPHGLAGGANDLPNVPHGLAGGANDLAGAPQGAEIVIVGGDRRTRGYAGDAAGSLRPYGLDLMVGDGEPVLPLSLTIGRWLLGAPPARFQSVAYDATPAECVALGRELVRHGPVGLLVMGDGSACRTEKAPGYLDPRAAPYDAAVARALGEADAAALAALDPGLSRELQAAGRAAWQVLSGAAGEAPVEGTLLADQAPYGVGYFVASWWRA